MSPRLTGARAEGTPDLRPDLARAIEAVAEPLVVMSAAGVVSAFNLAAAKRFALSAEGGPAPFRLLSLDGEPLTEEPWGVAARTETVVERRVMLEDHDGSRQSTLVRAVPAWEPDGALGGVLVTLVDASCDSWADMEECRRAFDLNDDILVVATPRGRLVRLNDGAARMLGWPPKSFLGRSLDALVHPDDLERFLEATSSGRPSSDLINRLKSHDGEVHFVSWTLRPERSPVVGPVVYMRGVDVTQKLHREEELVASRAQLAEAQDIAHIGTLVIDYRTNRVEPSLQLRRLVALPDDADLPALIKERVGAPDRARLDDAVRLGRKGDPSTLQLTARLPHGPRELKIWIRPHAESSGEVVRLVAVVQDITDEVRLAAQLRLSERMASLGTLASGVAHEVNNPLAFIVANLNTVRGELNRVGELPGVDLSDIRAALSEAQEGAERVASIVGSLKAFSRGDDERTPVPCDLRPILEGVLNLARNETRHRARVIKDFQPVPLVVANQARLGQLFLNLVLNAAQAIPDGHMEQNLLTVSTEASDGAALVTVQDTGEGIAPENLGRVFDPFFSTKRTGRGAGMGLFIALGLAREMGGDIQVESSVGAGTRFRVRLPAAGALDAEPTPSADVPLRGRVLVVDSEPLLLRSLSRMLGRAHDVTTASDGREALEILTQQDFDLVLCDLMTPGLSGVELWERLPKEQRAKLVFMTAGALSTETRGFLVASGPPVLQKPFTADTLSELLELHMRIAPEARPR